MGVDAAQSGRLTVAIPRVLWWFRLWPFWKTFFEQLGCRVLTNDPTRRTPRHHDRSSTIVEEACFPIQLLLDRTLALAPDVEAVFIPRLISVDPRGIMCPRFAGVPDIVRMVLPPGSRLLSPVIDAREGRRSVCNAYLQIADQIRIARPRAVRAFRAACTAQKQFETQFEARLNRLPTPDVFDMQIPLPELPPPKSAFRIALLGHPYIAYDWEFNLNLIEKLRSFDAWLVPVESFDHHRIEKVVRKLDKNVYWSSGRDVLGAALTLFQSPQYPPVQGIAHLSCFKCGVDGLLTEVVKWTARHHPQMPLLPLLLDGHDNELGLLTRLEAFLDIIRSRR